jgi:hypothetical protein
MVYVPHGDYSDMLQLIASFQKEIISVVLSLVTTGILYLFRARAELIWASPHSWTFSITPPAAPAGQPANVPFSIQTASIFIQNSGRLPATDVELTFNWEPQNLNIWPPRPFTTIKSPDGRFTMQFTNLAPKEFFQLELLASVQLPLLTTVRSKECTGKLVQMVPSRTLKQSVIYLRWTLLVLGMAVVIYLPIKLLSLVF